MTTLSLYLGAALAEIAGCFAFWVWLRLGKSVFWLIPGMLALAMFAYLLTRKVIYLNARLLKSCSPGHPSTPTKPIACVKNE